MTIHPLQEMTCTDYQAVVWIGSSAPFAPKPFLFSPRRVSETRGLLS